MVVTVEVPNVNLELACTIRDICRKWGVEDYTVVKVEWETHTSGFFLVSGKIQTRHAFKVSVPYADWYTPKITTLEVTK